MTLQLRVRLFFLDHSSTFVISSSLVSTFTDGMIRYVLSAYLHSKFPETLVKIGPVCSVIILV